MPQQAEANRANHASDPVAGHAAASAAQPAFGKRNTQKPIKAIIGIVILLVLSFVLYELKDKSRDHQTTPATSQSNPAPKH